MKPATMSHYESAMQHAIEQVAGRLDESLDLHALAAEAFLSPYHFHRVFRGMVGETPLEMARRLRLERAAWQLLNSSDSVATIAFDAGYETHEAFARTFRITFGTTPTGFRKRTHAQTELTAANGIHFAFGQPVNTFIPSRTGGASMHVDLQECPAVRLGTVRHIGPYNQIAEGFERLGGIADAAGLFAYPDVAMIALYHDDPESNPQDELRADAAIVVDPRVELPPGLDETWLPAGTYAHTVHTGPYRHLGDAWSRFMGEWLPASGYRLGEGTSYELYLDDPATVPEDELRTALYLPVA